MSIYGRRSRTISFLDVRNQYYQSIFSKDRHGSDVLFILIPFSTRIHYYTWSSRKGRDGRVPCANSKHKQAFSCWRTFIVLLLSWSSWLDHGIEKIYDNVLLKGNDLHMNKRGMSLKSNDFSEKNHEFIVVCLIWICLGIMANVYTTV